MSDIRLSNDKIRMLAKCRHKPIRAVRDTPKKSDELWRDMEAGELIDIQIEGSLILVSITEDGKDTYDTYTRDHLDMLINRFVAVAALLISIIAAALTGLTYLGG